MKLDYYVCNPTGNITLLVDTQVIIFRHPEIAAGLMTFEETAEQVGFIFPGDDECDIKLRMAGGEFCGNAAMSAAGLFCHKEGLRESETRIVKIKVSGIKEVLDTKITRSASGYEGQVKMPKPIKIKDELFKFEGRNYLYPLVNFDGISHIIIEDDMPIYMAENAIKSWCEYLKVPALGLMLLSKENTALNPLVYVKNSDTLFWESSCASGTSAVGAYMFQKERKPVNLTLREPGGNLKVCVDKTGEIFLEGFVEIGELKTVEITK